MEKKNSFYREIFRLVLPMALQNVMNTALQMADVVMLGSLDEKALSAVSLGGQVSFLLFMFLFGTTSGAGVLAAQYWGKKDRKSIETVMGIVLRLSLIGGGIFVILTFFFPHIIMGLLTSDPVVKELGIEYLRIICFSYILTTFILVYLNVMRSMERVVISTVVYGIGLVVNVIGNTFLIFGIGPFPRLEVAGAAYATVFAIFVEVLVVLAHNRWKNDLITVNLKTLFLKNKMLRRDFLRISVPVILNEFIWGIGTAATTAIIGQLGSAASAANAVVSTVRQLAMVATYGIANSSAIVVGKALGAGLLEDAFLFAKKYVRLILISGLVSSGIVLLSRPVAIHFLELTVEAGHYLSIMLWILAVSVIAQAYTALMIVGIFRCGGDTRFAFYLDACSVWFVSVLLGVVTAFVLRWPPTGVFGVMVLNDFAMIPFIVWRYRSKKWMKNITREFG